jgi:DNA-binding transcriptional MocR family regulator
MDRTPDPAQYVGIHARVSDFVSRGRLQMVKTNLAVARCSPALYPGEALKQSAMRVLRKKPDILVSASSPRGNSEFRAVLAKRALQLGMALSPEQVQITHGCMEALNLALRAVAQPGDTIAVESPTFYGLLQVLESLGLRALEIPTSPLTGMSIDALELAIRTYDNIKAVVVVPHLQNPLGSIMPDAHKQRLVQLCEASAITLIEDDTYSELVSENTRGNAPLRAMKSWDRTGNVIYCASLHKILAPGIASPDYDRHLRHLRSTLLNQRQHTAETIANHFPEGTRLTVPDGGLSLWVEMPQQLSSKRVFDAALQEQILVSPGLMFSNSLRFDPFLRISCGWPVDKDVEQALRRLGQIVTQLL